MRRTASEVMVLKNSQFRKGRKKKGDLGGYQDGGKKSDGFHSTTQNSWTSSLQPGPIKLSPTPCERRRRGEGNWDKNHPSGLNKD